MIGINSCGFMEYAHPRIQSTLIPAIRRTGGTHLRVAIDCGHNDFAQRVKLDLVRALLQRRAEFLSRGCLRGILKDQSVARSLCRRHRYTERGGKRSGDGGRSTPPWRSRDELLYSVCVHAGHDGASMNARSKSRENCYNVKLNCSRA